VRCCNSKSHWFDCHSVRASRSGLKEFITVAKILMRCLQPSGLLAVSPPVQSLWYIKSTWWWPIFDIDEFGLFRAAKALWVLLNVNVSKHVWMRNTQHFGKMQACKKKKFQVRAHHLSIQKFSPGRARTSDLTVNSRSLWPTELQKM
jgi:hypothetical protein